MTTEANKEQPAQKPALATTMEQHEHNAAIARTIKNLWTALLSPKWGWTTRKDLEKLGEALYSGKQLKELDPELFNRIFPHIKVVAETLLSLTGAHAPDAAPETAPAPAPQTQDGG